MRLRVLFPLLVLISLPLVSQNIVAQTPVKRAAPQPITEEEELDAQKGRLSTLLKILGPTVVSVGIMAHAGETLQLMANTQGALQKKMFLDGAEREYLGRYAKKRRNLQALRLAALGVTLYGAYHVTRISLEGIKASDRMLRRPPIRPLPAPSASPELEKEIQKSLALPARN